MKKVIGENSDKYAYVGLMTRTDSKKVDGTRKDVTYATEIYVTLQEEYTRTGEVTDF